jgi:mRNA-binding protein PUF3
MLEYIAHDSDYEIIKEYLANNVFSLVKDTNGNHVIQKILQIYPNQKNTFILKEIEENIVEISKLKQGSCIFQKVLEYSRAVDKVRHFLIIKIKENYH